MWIPGASTSRCWTKPALSFKTPFTTAMRARMVFLSACSASSPADEIYKSTGVQFMQINTLFQVFALADRHPATASRRAALPHDSRSAELLAYGSDHLRIHECHHHADVRHTGT